MMALTPGDPVEIMVGGDENITEAQMDQMRHELGLDLPLPVRFLHFVGNAVVGDFGLSFYHRRPVIDVLLERLPATIELAVAAMLVALAIAIPAGIAAAVRRGSLFDKLATTVSVAGVAIPNFWLGIVLIMFFAVQLGWLPVSGQTSNAINIPRVTGFALIDSVLWGRPDAVLDVLKHLALPAITLGTGLSALLMRVTRTSMIETMQQEYVAFATAKGLSRRRVLFHHALRNALIPVVTVIAIDFGSLLSGSIITETIFAWPGVGRLLIEGVTTRNYPLVQTAVLMFALFYIVANFIADVLYVVLNPRIRLAR
ncbi:MAG: ABC transporter permease [Hyphomicrobiaceae bacterium]|nr:ABC transporter permease [Hyphomicrobiaceae bacterium]